ncbi:MAG: hypothetical protein K0V04_01355 [Deltaproteobacteria bacterium]|nr:hypothetical protein [Deltaproteobacteria bacterium]
MLSWLLVTALVGPPAESTWSPAEAPPPTPWALAGARGWRLCQEAERQARTLRDGAGGRSSVPGAEDRLWQRRAEQCPHAVEVLTAAAQAEIVASTMDIEAPPSADPFGEAPAAGPSLEAAADEQEDGARRALRWLDTAIEESARRRVRPPATAYYYRAYVLTALGRVEQARAAIEETIAAGDVERWRSERMFALIALFAGDMPQALRRAHRGVVGARQDDRAISRYIRALVFDRAGASSIARAELIALQRDANARVARGAVQSVLPPHERLFFRALDHQANGNRSPALRLWQAYLARPEPEEPERVLAQRHLDELEPSPARIGDL